MGDEGRRYVLTAFPRKKLGERYLNLARGQSEIASDPFAAAHPWSPDECIEADRRFARASTTMKDKDIAKYVSNLRSHPLYSQMSGIKNISMLHVDVLLLLRLLSLSTRNGILEIGPYIGGSTIAIASGVRDGKSPAFVSIEPGGKYLEHPEYPSADILGDLKTNLRTANVSQYVTIIEGRSNDDAVRDRAHDLLRKSGVSLLFIDADGEVGRDIELYGSLLKPGCFVVFDDYFAPGAENKEIRVRSFVDEEVRRGRLDPLGVFGWGTWVGRYTGDDVS